MTDELLYVKLKMQRSAKYGCKVKQTRLEILSPALKDKENRFIHLLTETIMRRHVTVYNTFLKYLCY